MYNMSVDSCQKAPESALKTYRVEDIARILGIGRSTAYNLVREGRFTPPVLIALLELALK